MDDAAKYRAAEDEFLVKLVEMVTGTVVDAPQDIDQ
jgi:hypothetical protein